MLLKYIVDFTLSLFALILLLPMILVVSWQIRRKLGSPVFFLPDTPWHVRQAVFDGQIPHHDGCSGPDGSLLPDVERLKMGIK